MRLERSDGAVIDVSWEPEESPDGMFIGRVIRRNDWENPAETFETRDPVAIMGWVAAVFSRGSK